MATINITLSSTNVALSAIVGPRLKALRLKKAVLASAAKQSSGLINLA